MKFTKKKIFFFFNLTVLTINFAKFLHQDHQNLIKHVCVIRLMWNKLMVYIILYRIQTSNLNFMTINYNFSQNFHTTTKHRQINKRMDSWITNIQSQLTNWTTEYYLLTVEWGLITTICVCMCVCDWSSSVCLLICLSNCLLISS